MKKTGKTHFLSRTGERTILPDSDAFHQEARRRMQELMSGVRSLDAARWLSVPEHVLLLRAMQQRTALFMAVPEGEHDRQQRQQYWQNLEQFIPSVLDEVLLFVGRRHQYLRLQARLGECYAGAVVHLYMTQLLALYSSGTHWPASA